ncbi:MAG: small subunit ribosomal protein S11 [Parcubacteria group bacterium Gr01-1014_17]|nr:MAG: small subunit ribosomal protein S11 [Parcubacteria group bacterium Gr01-1014_17]
MGKKRIITKGEAGAEAAGGTPAVARSKKKIESGILTVRASYNNTTLTLADDKGNVVAFSSSGALGFQGAKKGTPFAAAKVGETLGAKGLLMGMKEVSVVVRGVGSGRESAIRGFMSKGIMIKSIKDVTPVPFNGPRPKKPRRV